MQNEKRKRPQEFITFDSISIYVDGDELDVEFGEAYNIESQEVESISLDEIQQILGGSAASDRSTRVVPFIDKAILLQKTAVNFVKTDESL